MLRLRILTAVVGLPLVLAAILLGPNPFSIFLTVVAGVCTFEISRLAPGMPRRDPLLVVAVAWGIILATRHTLFPTEPAQSILITAPLVVALLLLLPGTGRSRTFLQWSWTISGALYVGWLFGHWGGLYLLPGGPYIIIFGMITTFAYDTFAFFTGRALGHHKMAPRISAAKTWEGAAGGMAASIVIALLLRMAIVSVTGSFLYSAGVTVLATVGLVVAAQLGDLVESAMKRAANTKDAGTALPGHGGMLDRFDSLLFVGPMLYYFSLWIAI